MKTCRQCQTEIKPRRIVFGRAGAIELECCECEASRLALKYENTGKADNRDDLFVEDL